MSEPIATISERALLTSALMFYTRLPVPQNALHSEDILNRSRKYFPFIGVLIGLVAACVFYLSHLFFSHAMAVLLSMIATILATGAFHEDGFADSCDGLGGGQNTKQVLTIMKDSRLGTYAAIGIAMILALKFLLLEQLSHIAFTEFALVMIGAHAVSRKLSSLVIEHFEYVQDIDVSKVKPITDRRLNSQDMRVSTITVVIIFGLLAMQSFWATLWSCIAAGSLAYRFANYCQRRIGGYTGDILGAIQQITEVAFYLIYLGLVLTFY